MTDLYPFLSGFVGMVWVILTTISCRTGLRPINSGNRLTAVVDAALKNKKHPVQFVRGVSYL